MGSEWGTPLTPTLLKHTPYADGGDLVLFIFHLSCLRIVVIDTGRYPGYTQVQDTSSNQHPETFENPTPKGSRSPRLEGVEVMGSALTK